MQTSELEQRQHAILPEPNHDDAAFRANDDRSD